MKHNLHRFLDIILVVDPTHMTMNLFNSFKRERIHKDQLFLNLHKLTFVGFMKHSFYIFLDNTWEIDPSHMATNIHRDVGPNESYNLIFLLVNAKLRLVILQIWNCSFGNCHNPLLFNIVSISCAQTP